jgi:hypothetical protein
MGFLSGTKNESVVFGQRKRIGGELVQRRVLEEERRLYFAALLLLAKNVADVIGSESACCVGFRDGGGDRFRPIFAGEPEQFADLAGQ